MRRSQATRNRLLVRNEVAHILVSALTKCVTHFTVAARIPVLQKLVCVRGRRRPLLWRVFAYERKVLEGVGTRGAIT